MRGQIKNLQAQVKALEKQRDRYREDYRQVALGNCEDLMRENMAYKETLFRYVASQTGDDENIVNYKLYLPDMIPEIAEAAKALREALKKYGNTKCRYEK